MRTDTARRLLFLVLRSAFRALPLSPATRDRWRQRFLDRHMALVPAGPRGQVPGADVSLLHPADQATGRAIGHVEPVPGSLPAPLPATVLAFYLPQFHRIPENDRWWGEGFTEWTNVTRALPQFDGHHQPRLPGALGFYDLAAPETMARQAALARSYGIGGFCSYFYWFAGRTLLEAPLRQWLAQPDLDLPLCLCWANENWSRRWDGRAEDILMAQAHSAEDDLAFIAHIARYLRDPRYVRVEGRPLLLVYRPGLLPDARATAGRWREWCRHHGVGELHLAYVQSFDRAEPAAFGFDAAVEFPPNNTGLRPITGRQQLRNPGYAGDVFDWRELAADAMARPDPGYPLYPGVNPGWDNEPRRSGRGRVFAYASPRGYRDWLAQAIDTARRRFPQQPLVFVNAWNEWAEGAVLEPDQRLGHAWLEATRQALWQAAGAGGRAVDRRPCAVVHAWYVDVLPEILQALQSSSIDWRLVITTTPDRAAAVRASLEAAGRQAEVEVFENRGRDILPFLQVAGRLLDEGTPLLLKLHTKRSVHREDGAAWRGELLGRLLAPGRAVAIENAFRTDPGLGLVHAEGHRLPLRDYWGANEGHVRSLARAAGLALTDHDAFIAGSMFWTRPSALRPLLDAHLPVAAFEAEAGQVDGTCAHAVERLFELGARAAGLDVRSAASLVGEAEDGRPYPYARPGSRPALH